MASTDPGPGFQIGDVAVPNTVAPLGPAPVVRASDLLGSHRTVDTVLERDGIDAVYRDEGMTVWVTGTGQLFRLVGGIANGDWQLVNETNIRVSETFTPSLGQTVFNLAMTPSAASSVDFFLNTARYRQGLNFTVAGQVITWLDNPFTLDPGDDVEILYFI